MKMEKKHDCVPSIFVFDKKGPLRFGGKAMHKGVTPAGCKIPMHHILTLDTSDPLCPVRNIEAKELPLYYPLRYTDWGGDVQYWVNKDSSIDIICLGECVGEVPEADDGDFWPFPNHLPARKGHLRALTYKEARAVAFADLYDCYPHTREDINHLKTAGWKNGIRIGGESLTCQGPVLWQCKNKKCVLSKYRTTLEPIALISNSPIEEVDIFDDCSVQIFFGLCRGCGSIVAVNRCD